MYQLYRSVLEAFHPIDLSSVYTIMILCNILIVKVFLLVARNKSFLQAILAHDHFTLRNFEIPTTVFHQFSTELFSTSTFLSEFSFLELYFVFAKNKLWHIYLY